MHPQLQICGRTSGTPSLQKSVLHGLTNLRRHGSGTGNLMCEMSVTSGPGGGRRPPCPNCASIGAAMCRKTVTR